MLNKKNLNNIINVRINSQLFNELSKISNDNDIQLSKIIRTVLEHYVNTYKNNNYDNNEINE